MGDDIVTSTQVPAGGADPPSFGGSRELSPVARRRDIDSDGPRFITGLFQDEDLRLEAIGKEGGLTFSHSRNSDVGLLENDGASTIPPRYPPMSETTVDWSVIYMPEYGTPGGRRRRGAHRRQLQVEKRKVFIQEEEEEGW